jgi:hypothetical protein
VYDYKVYRRQDCLLQTLAKTPQLGKHVRELNWTSLDISWICEDDWEDQDLALKVNNILAPSRENLKHLELNILLQWSEASPPLPQNFSSEQLEAYWRLHSTKHKPIPNTRLMAGALDCLLDHCATLTSLCITTASNGGDWIDSKSWDDRRYSSWAHFLTSVLGQLHNLSFKQGTSKATIAHLWSCRRPR